eukprot:scaffold213854_cov23-Prasinocladus_malaysianus.AAC.1
MQNSNCCCLIRRQQIADTVRFECAAAQQVKVSFNSIIDLRNANHEICVSIPDWGELLKTEYAINYRAVADNHDMALSLLGPLDAAEAVVPEDAGVLCKVCFCTNKGMMLPNDPL